VDHTGRSPCEKSRELVRLVVQHLDELAKLTAEQRAARLDGSVELAAHLDAQLDLKFGEKERSVGAWQQHAREHGC